jgi:hypothetical protein
LRPEPRLVPSETELGDGDGVPETVGAAVAGIPTTLTFAARCAGSPCSDRVTKKPRRAARTPTSRSGAKNGRISEPLNASLRSAARD